MPGVLSLAELLANPAVRAAVVAELLRQADVDDDRGQRAYNTGHYTKAIRAWQLRARRINAATAVEACVQVYRRDETLVHEAATIVLDRRQAAAQTPGGAR